MLGDILDAADEHVRVLQLGQNDRQHLFACQRHRDRVRQAEQLPEPLVEVRDDAVVLTTRIPSAVESSVALSCDSVSASSVSASLRAVMSWTVPEMTVMRPSTTARDVGSAVQPALFAIRCPHPEVSAEGRRRRRATRSDRAPAPVDRRGRRTTAASRGSASAWTGRDRAAGRAHRTTPRLRWSGRNPSSRAWRGAAPRPASPPVG